MLGPNPLGLSGPVFLVLYGVFAAGALFWAWLSVRRADRTECKKLPLLPQAPDAIELAYLRGGADQVVRTIIYDLVSRGFARLTNTGVVRTETRPGAELSEIESLVLAELDKERKPAALFFALQGNARFKALLAPARKNLTEMGLLLSDSVYSQSRKALAFGALALLGVGCAKIALALAMGHNNVLFLILLMLPSLILLIFLTHVPPGRPASRRGLAYLENMRVAYRDRLDEAIAAPGATRGHAFDASTLFLVSLFGFSALTGTADADFAETFKRSDSNSGGCGAACGSGCGGGCGGECGGGCGGGCGG